MWLAPTNLLSNTDIITSNLDYIFLKSAGSIENLNTNSSLVIEPLISTSKESMLIERYKMQFRADPEQLLKDFDPQDKSYIIGARIKGEFNLLSLEDIKKIELDTNQHINNIKMLILYYLRIQIYCLIILGYQNRTCLEETLLLQSQITEEW